MIADSADESDWCRVSQAVAKFTRDKNSQKPTDQEIHSCAQLQKNKMNSIADDHQRDELEEEACDIQPSRGDHICFATMLVN